MSDNNTSAIDRINATAVADTVPLEPPPAYEPKPEDVDNEEQTSEQPAKDETESESSKLTSHFQRILLYSVLAVVAYWLTLFLLYPLARGRPGVLYSSIYSKDYRFRPAASPIITETLADGRTRVRGGHPTAL